ncbi:MAG: TetR/AcrR family transcriptional regulator [Spirochaetaceae bacterium]|nr:TetR/AcrR family transcriptional regulator [Spirochaetaceae bacterium]
MPRNKSTKKKIFFVAVDFFAEKGFKHCTMQEIADKVNIKAPSIYKHFINKKEILTEIFEYYKNNLNKHRLPVEKILEAIDHEPPGKVFTKLFSAFETEEEYALMMKISKIVIGMSYENEDAKKIFQQAFVEEPTKYLNDVFTKLIDSGKIKLFDYESLTFQIIAFSRMIFETSLPDGTDRAEMDAKYNNGIALLAKGFERADLLVR